MDAVERSCDLSLPLSRYGLLVPLPDPLVLLQEFVSLTGPPGQEVAIREAVARHVASLGLTSEVDAKGNLIVCLGESPRVVVTAHLDEIALMVREVEPDGKIVVAPMGGIFPWKLGEIPLRFLIPGDVQLDGVLSFGSIHSEDAGSAAVQAKTGSLTWPMARVLTGLSATELADAGVRPGTRVVVHPDFRGLVRLGPLVAGRFLDDRADLVAWLLALEALKDESLDVAFVATAAEEVGGEGATWFLRQAPAEVCIALELSPNVPDAPVEIDDRIGVWTTDGYSSMSADDGDLVASLGFDLQWQALSRGGSDASCAASLGLCARPITLGLPMDNSHGFEVMHPGAMTKLGELTAALVRRI